jgi:Tfp pilus assembly major pilin PilA
MKNKKAITLIELIIVIGIVSILTGFAVPYVNDMITDSKRKKVSFDVNNIADMVNKYQFKDEVEIEYITELKTNYIVNLEAMKDAWGNKYRLNTSELLVYSIGNNSIDEKGFGDDIKAKYINRVEELSNRRNALLDLKKIKKEIDSYLESAGASMDELENNQDNLLPNVLNMIDPWGQIYIINIQK